MGCRSEKIKRKQRKAEFKESCNGNFSETVSNNLHIHGSQLCYFELLVLHLQSMEEATVGKIINILADDLDRIVQYTTYLGYLILTPLQILTLYASMWYLLGTAAFSGALFFTILLPIMVLGSKISSVYRLKASKIADSRVNMMKEIISGIKAIKMYVWELSFTKIINDYRKEELRNITKYLLFQIGYYHFAVLKLASAISVLTMLYVNGILFPEIIFSCIQFLVILKKGVLAFMPQAMLLQFEITNVFVRISELLLMNEVDIDSKINADVSGIQLDQIKASWSTKSSFVISSNNINIPSRSLTVIIGPVGSGKSTLLQLLLGELKLSSGNIQMNGSVSYSGQESWLFTSSLKNNILFGNDYDYNKYQQVVSACSLLPDFDQLRNGDLSCVGEQGVLLSGGQKARINLARAVYRDADIYLLDDPLSAVDSEVGKRIFDECVKSYLRDKTRLLVTHHLQYLQEADQIIIVDKGNLESFDSLSEIKFKKPEIFEWIQKLNKADETKETTVTSKLNLKDESDQKLNYVCNENRTKITPRRALFEYIKSGSCIIPLFLTVFSAQLLLGLTDYWLLYWTKQSYSTHAESKNVTENSNVHHMRDIQWTTEFNTNFTIYCSIVSSAFLMLILSNILLTKFFNTASKNMYKNMYKAVISAPLSFFYTHPSGRILNRFSSDTTAVDVRFADNLKDISQVYFMGIGSIILVIVSDYYMSFFVLIVFIYAKLLKWYQYIGSELKHLEITAKSPIYTYINNTLSGITTIRATKNQEKLQKEFIILLNNHTSVLRLNVLCGAAFSVIVDTVCAFFLFGVIFALILLNEYDHKITPGVAGLAILQVFQLMGALQFATQKSLDFVQYLMSIERMIEFSKIEPEEFSETKKNGVYNFQPGYSGAEVVFKNVSMFYNKGSLVLNGINVSIASGEKVGVVGRTGAGKSSLINVLLRLSEFSGSVQINGVDTKTMPLEILRKRVSIIPQDPVLFTNTVRYNLDPFGEFTDDNLWTVIKQVELKDCITSLDSVVTSGGNNFSTGEKQLICLARAILRKNELAILDEATANVDQRTDELIQRTLKMRFANFTLITIAHRLQTIMQTDKVLLMDNGYLVECDHPYRLILKRGKFYDLVQQTGDATAAHLEDMAYKHFTQHHS
ncbi:ATP-binding cassette sub-family C member 4-like isoform X2 [Diabrotica virgifera virgifera]|uniref:Multidrug resistance-associated protein 4-like n=1 Tax=Diabrotica virgifera virgifera TaxID=50390 RepID=A0ABM5KKN3_DIAVI|nr:ATP-binding cassette sub-family C member 4-like isoform X2 [Diabrotica virgifera virgifera]